MIYIVIAVHDRLAATLECLACIAEQTYTAYQVVLVDDGSTDGTADAVMRKYPNTKIITGDGNLWWTGAMAKGIEYILPEAAANDYVLSLNNDVTFQPDYLQSLVNTSQQRQNAVVGSLCRDVLPPHEVFDAGITMRWYKYVYGQLTYNDQIAVADQIDTISGRGVLIPVSVIQQIGNFDYRYLPHYGADYEYGFRVKRANIPMVVDYHAVVYLKNELTGFRPTAEVLSYRDQWRRLFSIKSPANVIVHLKLIWRYCPKWTTKCFDLAYVILGNAYIAARSTLLYTLQLCHLRKSSS